MSCGDILKQVSAYVDGELSGSQREEVEAHLSGCPCCAHAAEGFRKLDEYAGRVRPPSVRGEEWAQMWETLRTGGAASARGSLDSREPEAQERFRVLAKERPGGPAGRGRGGVRKLALAVASLAALVLIGLWVGPAILEPGSGRPGPQTAAPSDTEATRKTENYAQHLDGPEPEIDVDPEDGTIHLNYEEF